MTRYKIIVGNIGCVHEGNNTKQAIKEYDDWVKTSKALHSRASGEDVTLLRDEDVWKEYMGHNNIDDE